MQEITRKIRSIIQVGESLAITIPRRYAREQRLNLGDFVVLECKGDSVVIRPLELGKTGGKR